MGAFGPGEELITAPVDLVVGIPTDRSYLSERHATTAPLQTTQNSDTLRVMTRLPRDIVSRRSRTTSVTVLALGPSLWLGCEAVVRPVPGPAATFSLLARDTILAELADAAFAAGFMADYDVAADGQRVLAILPERDDFRIVVSPNWITEFRQRVAEGDRKRRQ